MITQAGLKVKTKPSKKQKTSMPRAKEKKAALHARGMQSSLLN
jgi:hypothetical protein